MAKGERVDKILSNVGCGSRAEMKRYCKYGLVRINDKVVKDPSVHVDVDTDKIEFEGKLINYRKYVYIMLNKPAGCVSATFDKKDQTVIDLLDSEYIPFEPFPVGRLDKDTEGLLILTNDGQLSHRVLSPKKHVPKTYFAHIRGKVTDDDVRAFEEGVVLDDGYKTMPAKLSVIKSDDISHIRVVIHEGKFHQVKRMFESVNKEVIYLKREQMGSLKLDENLALGEYREISEDEIQLLQKR